MWARRAITLPLLVVVTVLSAALLPITLPLAGVIDVVRGGPWPLVRCLAYLTIYLCCEVAGVTSAAILWVVSGPWTGSPHPRFLARNVALQAWWANALYRGVERVFRVRTIVEGEETIEPGPILVFIRHLSQADTLLPVVIVTRRHGIALRFVLKQELLWDPCLDVVGRRLPNVFVRRGSGESEREIAAVQRLMTDLGPRDGVLIYPEGTRFTPEKRARALDKLATRATPALVERAERLRHVLPPHVGGPLGLLAANRNADVVFCAHTGFESAGSPADLFGGALVGATIRVRYWRVPAADIPTETDARIFWLYEHWQRIDDWVDRVHPLSG